ncbi:MAG: PDZ domain-containing protein [Planctomycetota bacterium]
MNVAPLKLLSYLTSAGLVGGIGYLGYDYYENGRHASFFDSERATEVLNGVQPPPPQQSSALLYESDIRPAVVDFDWTGRPPEERSAMDVAELEEVTKPVVPVSDILQVVSLYAFDTDPDESLCLVRFVDTSVQPRDRWYAVGSTLPSPNENVSVFRISGAGVEFSFADEERPRETLAAGEGTASGLIARVDDLSKIAVRQRASVIGRREERATSTPRQTELRAGQYYVGTEDASAFAQNYGEILSRDVQTKTYFENGKRAGVEVVEVRSGSIAARHGAQSGDVILSINGHPVSSQQEAIQFAKQNSDRYSVWQVEVLRLGRVETLTYHSPDD